MQFQGLIDKLKDSRRSQGQRYTFSSLFLTCVLGHCCGYSGCREIARFARGHKKDLQELLAYKDRIPSHVTFHHFLNNINHDELSLAFNSWMEDTNTLPTSVLDTLAGDGKSLRSTVTNANDKDQKFTQIVSLFMSRLGLTLCLKDFENNKEGEGEVLRHLLSDLKKKGLL